jgi:hypothetical protein
VIDASNFFHMSRNMNLERKFMGLIHPYNGDHYWYTSLPMVSANPPTVSGIFGAAFFHLIYREMEEMQGEMQINDWRVALNGK